MNSNIKKIIVICIVLATIISYIANIINTAWSFLIIAVIFLYLAYVIGIEKDLSFANLVLRSDKPTQTDKNIGMASAIISLVIGLVLLVISIKSFF